MLDDCLERIKKGETIEACLSGYPQARQEMEPMLRAALSLSSLPRVQPSPEFVTSSSSRLINRISQDTAPSEADGVTALFRNLWHSLVQSRKLAIPVAIAALLIIFAGLYQFGGPGLISPAPVEDPPGTLTILSGSVEVQRASSEEWRPGTDGMILNAGMGIKTDENSHALLTFFEGSTIKLEPDTYLEIKRAGQDDEQSTAIILKQWLGRTWSRVIKMVDPGSRFEVETPSATAIVRGTLFSTEVEETGLTTVSTMEGLVSVAGQGEEVFIPPSQQTRVEKGTEPSEPVPQDIPKSQLRINIAMPAAGSVTDPTGASTGRMPDGFAYNQITGSLSLITSDNIHLIQIPDPITGEYIISLRFDDPQATRFTIQYLSEGEVISEHIGKLMPIREKEWQIRINLRVEDGVIVAAEFGDIKPIRDDPSEKIPGVTSGTDDSPSRNEDRGRSEDKGPDGDKGRSEDIGPDKDKGGSEDIGPDKDKGRSEDIGPDEDKGRSEDIGPDEERGGSENIGPDKDKSRSEDTGPDKDKGKGEDKGPDKDKGRSKDKKPDDDRGKRPDKTDTADAANDNNDKDRARGRGNTLTSS